MVRMALQEFNGELPRTQGHYLPDGFAVSARNANLTSGSLRPMKGGMIVHSFASGGMTDMVQHGSKWFGYSHDVDAAPGPVAEDRLYLTHENAEPQIYAKSAWYPLAVPTPTVAPDIGTSGTATDDDLTSDTVYAWTWVSKLGEESGISPLTDTVTFGPGITSILTGMPSATAVGGRPVAKKRIYRSTTSSSGATDLYFIAEIDASETQFFDTYGDNPDQEAITVRDFDPPPDDLRGLTAMPNGMMAGFSGKELRFCEPYQPHAWPYSYAQTCNETIIGLCSFGSSLAVMTAGNPYIVQGISPDAMAMSKVEAPYPCIAKQSIVDMGYAAVYASPLGLVQISESGASLASAAIWTREEWQALGPETIQATRFGLSYIFSYQVPNSAIRKVAVVNLGGDRPSLVHCDIIAQGFYSSPSSDSCYFLDEVGQNVVEFDTGEAMAYTWRSKPLRFSQAVSFGAVACEINEYDLMGSGLATMKIEDETTYTVELSEAVVVEEDGDTCTLDINEPEIVTEGVYSVTVETKGGLAVADVQVKFFGDGVLRYTHQPILGQIGRLPSGAYREWQMEITGRSEVVRVVMGQTLAEVGL